jgi:hypothetical protein
MCIWPAKRGGRPFNDNQWCRKEDHEERGRIPFSWSAMIKGYQDQPKPRCGGPTWMKIYASKSFSWCWTTIFSHPTPIVTSGPLTQFGVTTQGLLLVIIGVKSYMTIREKQATSGRWLGVSKWACQMYLVVHYFSWYKHVISAIHFHIFIYTSHNWPDISIPNDRFYTLTT